MKYATYILPIAFSMAAFYFMFKQVVTPIPLAILLGLAPGFIYLAASKVAYGEWYDPREGLPTTIIAACFMSNLIGFGLLLILGL